MLVFMTYNVRPPVFFFFLSHSRTLPDLRRCSRCSPRVLHIWRPYSRVNSIWKRKGHGLLLMTLYTRILDNYLRVQKNRWLQQDTRLRVQFDYKANLRSQLEQTQVCEPHGDR
jgi:hypothetical protein